MKQALGIFILCFTFSIVANAQRLKDKMSSWEYKECDEHDNTKSVIYSKELGIYEVPIFPKPIPTYKLDSLCKQFIQDSVKNHSQKHIPVQSFGVYYYHNNDISLALTDYYLIDEKDNSYCIEFVVSEKKYDLATHSYLNMIYVPNIGIVYAINTSYADPLKTKVARLVRSDDYSKKEIQGIYNKVYKYLMAECF